MIVWYDAAHAGNAWYWSDNRLIAVTIMTDFCIAIRESSNSGEVRTSKSRHRDVMKSDWEIRERDSTRGGLRTRSRCKGTNLQSFLLSWYFMKKVKIDQARLYLEENIFQLNLLRMPLWDARASALQGKPSFRLSYRPLLALSLAWITCVAVLAVDERTLKIWRSSQPSRGLCVCHVWIRRTW